MSRLNDKALEDKKFEYDAMYKRIQECLVIVNPSSLIQPQEKVDLLQHLCSLESQLATHISNVEYVQNMEKTWGKKNGTP